MGKQLFANLGFLLQISGLLTIIPVAVGLFFNETNTVISLFLAAVAFFGFGFLLNAFCERKDLDFKNANYLYVATFILLPLIGAIPYFYSATNLFGNTNILDAFTNGIFESVSGFTTTGFSFLTTPETIPNALRIYRSLTELMGGVGIVFLLLVFFQSKKSLSTLSESVGIDNINGTLRKTYLSVFGLYGIIILAFTGIFVLLGFTNVVNTITYVIDTLTGGFTPPQTQFQQYLQTAPQFFTVLLMFLGAVNFAFICSLFQRKIKQALTQEVAWFILILIIGTIAVAIASNIGVFDAFYHVLSMSASVGYTYIPLASFGETSLSLLIVLMLIGGCTFSMAGGIRISRIVAFAKTAKQKVLEIFYEEKIIEEPTIDIYTEEHHETLDVPIFIMLFLATLVVFAIIFTTMGVSFTNALFEMGSALTTNGISMGAITITMPIGYKWLTIAAMTIGRVELLAVLIAIIALRKKIPIRTPSLSTIIDRIIDVVKVIISYIFDWIKEHTSHLRR